LSILKGWKALDVRGNDIAKERSSPMTGQRLAPFEKGDKRKETNQNPWLAAYFTLD
jgi:hypothetical protein